VRCEFSNFKILKETHPGELREEGLSEIQREERVAER